MTQLYRIRSTINYGAGGPGLGTHYFRPSVAGGSSADALVCATAVRAFWNAFAAQISNQCTVLVQGGIDLIEDTDGSLHGGFSVAPPAAVVGTGATPYLPVFVSIVCRYQCSAIVANRRVAGRTYVGPLSAAAAASGISPSVAAGAAAVTAVGFLTAVTPSTAVIWSRPNPLRSRVGSNATIVGGSADSFFGSLRSRRD